jgi:uncharacterized surface protein with fasciclin (FAS1) repeats
MFDLSRRTIFKAGAMGLMASLPAKISLAADPSSETALAMMTADPRFSEWVQVLEFAGLTQYAIDSRFTAFVPTNTAFSKFPGILDTLLKGRGRAFPDSTVPVQFVRSHVVLDLHPLSEFAGKKATVTAVSGNPITVDGTQNGIFTVTWQSLNGTLASAQMTDSPLLASNAIIYPVDRVAIASG